MVLALGVNVSIANCSGDQVKIFACHGAVSSMLGVVGLFGADV
jgi:hypothetical protein